MPKFELELTETALHELERIRLYIADELKNSKAASRQISRIMLAVETIAVFPELHRVRRIDSEGHEIRFLPVDNYLILYYVDESRHIVNVIHIIFAARNLDTII